jgi:glucuronokinase
MIVRTRAYARAGLVGNPSDGYFGKTISIIIKNYAASATLYETPCLTIVPAEQDLLQYDSMDDLASNIATYGYYGGVRLIKAAIKRFRDYCRENSFEIDSRNFSIEYHSTIPQRVGLAGSSAIITAALRALMAFYGVTISNHQLANLALSVETEELGLPAGLQDRVIQAYEGCVYMDFNREVMEKRGYGEYERIDVSQLPPLYVASLDKLAEGTEVFHSNIRARWEAGDPQVVEAMRGFARCAEEVRELLLAGRGSEIGPILDRNFNIRASIYRISDQNLDLIRRARSLGASAKFAGSGGAIVGTYPDEAAYVRLEAGLREIGATVIRPTME